MRPETEREVTVVNEELLTFGLEGRLVFLNETVSDNRFIERGKVGVEGEKIDVCFYNLLKGESTLKHYR